MNRSLNNRRQSGDGSDYTGEGILYAENALRKKRQKGFFRFSIIFIALLIALILLFFAARALFKVENYIISGNTKYTEEQIIDACGIERGTFMFTFAGSDVEKRIAKKCPYVDKVTMKREYPSSLVIEIAEISSVFVTHEADKYIAFSNNLKVLEVSDENGWGEDVVFIDLPQISVAIEGKPLTFLQDEKTEHIVPFIEALEFYYSEYRIKKADLTQSYDIVLYCGEGHEVHFGKSDELNVKMKTLSKMLKSDRIAQTQAAKIDVSNPKEPSFVPINVE